MALKTLTTLIVPSSALIASHSVLAFPNILPANTPKNVGKNPLLVCSFVSFLIGSVIHCISNPDS